MVPEAPFEETEHGLWPAGRGWFVVNARDLRWNEWPGRRGATFTGESEFEADNWFPMLGVNLAVLEPGVPNSAYHWETEQEAFLVLHGEERPLRQWDFVHCPPETRHVLVGAGDEPCVLLVMSSRQFQAKGPWGWYVANEVAERYGASPPESCQDTDVAYANFAKSRPVRYGGWLPG